MIYETGDNDVSLSVFMFSQTNGRLMSLNTTAKTLLIELQVDGKEPLTLASVERHITTGGEVTSATLPTETGGGTKELYRACRRQDGTMLKMSRIWSPDSNTVLVVEKETREA
jgi:hypothetical protein